MSRRGAVARATVLAAAGLVVAMAGAVGIASLPERADDSAGPDTMRSPAVPTSPAGPPTTGPSTTGPPTTEPPARTPPASIPPTTGDQTDPAISSCLDDTHMALATDGPAPEGLQTAIARALADPRLMTGVTAASVWVEGWGEVVAHNADEPLLPASNQKLATAIGALSLLDPDARLETRVLTAGRIGEDRLAGDLMLVGGGDPTVATSGAHSLDTLASAVRAAGIHSVEGSIIVDESRYSTERAAPGWLDWQRPAYGGALSALVVDRNQASGDPRYLADPALAAGEAFRTSLRRHGVDVVGNTRYGDSPPDSAEIAVLHSPTVTELIATMLLRSDNMVAESLFRELGVATGGDGSTTSAGEALQSALAALCIDVAGIAADGSGLSRADARSSGEWLRILHAAREQPWFHLLHGSLPVAGQTGTLAGRLGGAATAGNVRAKTGWTIPARGLSGYLTTVGGRDVVFSVIVNGEDDGSPLGDRVPGAEHAIDELVEVIAAWPT